MFFFKHRLKMTLLRIGKHRIVKNIASLRKVNIAHPYMDMADMDMADMEIVEMDMVELVDMDMVDTDCLSGRQRHKQRQSPSNTYVCHIF